MLANKNQYINSAYEQLQIISQDDKKRMEYEAREKTIRDYNYLINSARKEGAYNEKIETIKAFLQYEPTAPIEKIALFSRLSVQEVQEIIQQIS